jgi:ATP diphosphatase
VLDWRVFDELLAIVRRLRRECPWDRKQTVVSTRPLMLNEAYELDEALGSGDVEHITEELGDYLFMGLFMADVLGAEKGVKLEDALARIGAKLRNRHPHIYGAEQVESTEQVLENWERIKQVEKRESAGRESLLDGLPPAMPALKQAQLMQERCARVGFDWDDPGDVLGKVEEEVGEIRAELAESRPDRGRVAEELGDLFFALVNLCRHLGVDAESALRDANAKFGSRFRRVEQELARDGRSPTESSLEEMDAIWDRVKHRDQG